MTTATAPTHYSEWRPNLAPDLTDVLINDLIAHRGRWRDLGRLYLPDVPSFERCCIVRDRIEIGRRRGLVIEGDRRRGYRFVRFEHRPERRPAEPERQLSLAGELA